MNSLALFLPLKFSKSKLKYRAFFAKVQLGIYLLVCRHRVESSPTFICLFLHILFLPFLCTVFLPSFFFFYCTERTCQRPWPSQFIFILLFASLSGFCERLWVCLCVYSEWHTLRRSPFSRLHKTSGKASLSLSFTHSLSISLSVLFVVVSLLL